MVNLAFDPALHVLLVYVAGPQDASDHERVIGAIGRLDRDGRDHDRKVAFMLVLGPETQAPNAHWRRRYAEQRGTFVAPGVFVSVVTESAVLRGVMTAMSWIRPPPSHVKSVHHATFLEGAQWIEQSQGTPVAALRRLFDQAHQPR
jgi:hypothetical protein